MSRKHYVAIAQAIAMARRLDDKDAAISCIIGALISLFKRDNANFDAARFREACYREV